MKFLLFAAMSVFSLSNAALSANLDEWKCITNDYTVLDQNKEVQRNRAFIEQEVILRTEMSVNEDLSSEAYLYVVDGHYFMNDQIPFIKENDDPALEFWRIYDMRFMRNFREHAFVNFEKRIDFKSPKLETKQYLNVTFASFFPNQFYEELVMDCELIRSWTR